MEGGFKVSPLKLNAGIGTLERWDEQAIQARAEELSATAATVWVEAGLPPETLATYRTQPERTTVASYTIDDHRHLSPGSLMRPLFEILRKEVLALDPVVAEEFLKLYVAYKAETNFVDVIPQAARLLLTLNMGFHELHDPRNVTRDVSNMGRWGNGDIELGLSNLDELPYVMGLIRQSFEKQMGDGEAGA